MANSLAGHILRQLSLLCKVGSAIAAAITLYNSSVSCCCSARCTLLAEQGCNKILACHRDVMLNINKPIYTEFILIKSSFTYFLYIKECITEVKSFITLVSTMTSRYFEAAHCLKVFTSPIILIGRSFMSR